MEGGIILLWLALGAIPAAIAKGKGRSFGLWFAFGLVCFLIALIASLVIEDRQPCSNCGSPAPASATYCPSCGTQFAERIAARNAAAFGGYTPMQRDELRRRDS